MKFWKQFILMTFLMPRLFTHCLIHSVKRSGKLNKATAFFWQKWLEFVHGKKPFTILNSYALWSLSQNRDLWFTLPPQWSLLVSWLFSVISIPCLKIFFYHSSGINLKPRRLLSWAFYWRVLKIFQWIYYYEPHT